MDKIDELLFKYNIEYTMNTKVKKRLLLLLMPISIIYIMGVMGEIIALCSSEYLPYAYLAMIFCGIIIKLWISFCSGKIGTKNWKKKTMEYYRERFSEKQKRLVQLINSEGMSCQQVYNLLNSKYCRMSKKEDKMVYTISMCSVIIALTNIFIVPFQKIEDFSYIEYIAIILTTLFILGWIFYFTYKVLISLNESEDLAFLKKNNYEKVMKLLEDLLY